MRRKSKELRRRSKEWRRRWWDEEDALLEVAEAGKRRNAETKKAVKRKRSHFENRRNMILELGSSFVLESECCSASPP